MQSIPAEAREHWVVIPAAGRGTRMGGQAGDDPKSLLDVGGKPLLRHNLEMLAELGFVRAIIIVGYRRDRIQAALGNSIGGLSIVYVTATEYATTEHGFSLFLSRRVWSSDPAPVLMTDADNYFDPRIISRLLGERHSSAIAVQSGHDTTTEEELVLGIDGRVTGFVRGRVAQTPETAGLFLGVCRFTEEYMRGCYAFMEDLFARQGRGFKYERVFDLFHRTAQRPMVYVDCDDLRWVNLNRVEDLTHARRLAENGADGEEPVRK